MSSWLVQRDFGFVLGRVCQHVALFFFRSLHPWKSLAVHRSVSI